MSTKVRDEVEEFLLKESDLLDNHRYEEWLSLLHDDFVYRVPLPVAHEEVSQGRYDPLLELANESKSFLKMRFGRISSDYAWAERPAPYIRHFVSNLIVDEHVADETWHARTNVLVVRSRQPEAPVLASAGRHDVLQRHNGSFLLRERTVYLDTEVPNDSQIGVIY